MGERPFPHPDVVVVGAGWAGLAAGLALAERGLRVALLERRAHPGGRASSFPHGPTGLDLDNGQHVLLGCCTRSLAFLRRVGAPDAVSLQPRLRVDMRWRGRGATLGSVRLPGALHLLPALRRYPHLEPAERRAALRAAADLALGAAASDGESFGEWLARRGQGPAARERLWDPIVSALLNVRAAEASAALAVRTLRAGLCAGWQAARLGLFRWPLGAVAAAAVRTLDGLGVVVRCGRAALRLEVVDGAVRGVVQEDGTRIEARAVVLAVPPEAAWALLPDAWRAHPGFAGLRRLAPSPIVNVYVLYDRPVLPGPVLGLLDGEPLFAFDRGALLGRADLAGRLVGASVSAADALAGRSPEWLCAEADRRLRAGLPASAAGARAVAAVAVPQPRATFRAVPGSAACRPGPETPLRGLWLAGDWTDTGWPACLEGAVRSGERAAEAVARTLLQGRAGPGAGDRRHR